MKVFYVQINYKSGKTVEAEFESLSFKNGTYTWKTYGVMRPLIFGADDIESIWILGEREVGDVDQ